MRKLILTPALAAFSLTAPAKAEEPRLRGRFGEPEEIAAVVSFLASPAASLFVGQTLGANSGDVMLLISPGW